MRDLRRRTGWPRRETIDVYFLSLSIERNQILFTYADSESKPHFVQYASANNEGIFLDARRDEGDRRVRFYATRVTNNIVDGSTRYGIICWNQHAGVIAGNLVADCEGGIFLGGSSLATEIRANAAARVAHIGFRLRSSDGENVLVRNTFQFRDEDIKPYTEVLRTSGLDRTDLIEEPVGAPFPFREWSGDAPPRLPSER